MTSNVQLWKELILPQETALCLQELSHLVTGRSPTQIAPSLRHSHRNASAICCVQSSKHRGETGNPHSLHRLKPASTSRVPEEGTTRWDEAALPHHLMTRSTAAAGTRWHCQVPPSKAQSASPRLSPRPNAASLNSAAGSPSHRHILCLALLLRSLVTTS